MKSFGDRLFEQVHNYKIALFLQGELAQLTYQAFTQYARWVGESEHDSIEVTYPVGYRPDKTSIDSTRTYEKQELISRYEFLGYNQLPINSIFQLITSVEGLMGDIIRNVLSEYPAKIPNTRQVSAEIILESGSIETLKGKIIDSILNELNYKSPREFATEFKRLVGINLLEKPVFHKYIELKATRDIHIHNSGIANEIYLTKADTLARVRNGEFLPVTIQYFLESYEYCLQLTELLELELHKIWPSPDYLKSKQDNSLEEQQEVAVEKAIETMQELTHAEEVMAPNIKPPVLKRPAKKKGG